MWFLQKGNNYPYLEIVEDLVSKGQQLMVHTKVLPKLEEMFKGGIMWREKASRVFLRKNTPYTLMEVHFSSPKSIKSSAIPWVFNVMVHYWLPLVVQYINGCTIQEQWWLPCCNNMNKDIWLDLVEEALVILISRWQKSTNLKFEKQEWYVISELSFKF